MPQSVELDRLLANLRVYLPGAVIDVIRGELFETVREFLDFTNVWTEEIDVSIVAGTRAYTLTTATNGRINRLLSLFDSTDLNRVPIAPVRMEIPGQITLGMTPGQSATWVALVGLVNVDADAYAGDLNVNPDIPEWIYQQYRAALFNGTLFRMHSQGGKPYSNPEVALFRGKQFLSNKSAARLEVLRGNVWGNHTGTFPRNFANGSQRSSGSGGL